MRKAILRSAIVVLAGTFAAGAYAEKPEWAGEGKGKGKKQRKDRAESAQVVTAHFQDRHKVVVREYYGDFGRGAKHCPPGLAKKNNGCMPPGQAKKWRMGHPLPREVVYYEVPQKLVIELGVPPAGYKYVRVAGDILMIAVGTAMVVDAIQDLGRI